MCVNYISVSRQICFDWFRTPIEVNDDWRDEIYQDYAAPFIVHDEHGQRRGMLGSYGFVPQRHRPKKVMKPGEEPKFIRMSTMNARAEEVGEKRHYKKFWLESKLCLVPALALFEPNYEAGPGSVRWAIELASKEPFAMPGMWRTWEEPDGTVMNSFTHFTLNADAHPLLNRFHEPNEEKRGAAIVRPENYDDWLGCKNPEMARAFIELYPAELLAAHPAPRAPSSQSKKLIIEEKASASTSQNQGSLF
ncbi:SOS response-associated peptidase family protein [Rugamonas apoptosis]|uniref:Abasic site processing protein n=1 Tax=Rugamonas apoptosis TaxID=2758570 RepID=A0A7W2F734_9BURK|nr:SOS response-associated peptidase family protein [Rugamonas apoptosis]MBA5686321.1 SOS response-associated peptidase family protein [Rugamonas apoptosis]